VGIAGLVQGTLFLVDYTGGVLENWIAGLALAGSGTLLLAGFFTPIAGAVMAFTTVVAGASLPPARANFIGQPLSMVFVAIIAIAVALLGPGAFSLDRHLFGCREIIIPRTPPSPR
jgi:uncharacterized membrane protein YphA (DoxX/SURF4 family)